MYRQTDSCMLGVCSLRLHRSTTSCGRSVISSPSHLMSSYRSLGGFISRLSLSWWWSLSWRGGYRDEMAVPGSSYSLTPPRTVTTDSRNTHLTDGRSIQHANDSNRHHWRQSNLIMPALIKPGPCREGRGMIRANDRVASSGSELLRNVSLDDYLSSTILHSSFSFSDHHQTWARTQCSVVPNRNGFAHTVIRAWQEDLHLRLRPDDIWLAVLAQFNFFVNGNAEALRTIFVAHEEGQTSLIVDADTGTIETVDVSSVTQQLVSMLKQNLKDPNIASILLPSFTTTTLHDRTTAAIVFLGTMKEYFRYGILFGCSFPAVTLLGERSDWVDIIQRAAWFETIDHDEAKSWGLRLRKVLEYMVASFDRPDDEDVRQFWRSAVHEDGGDASGTIETLSGWLTAFCWWGADGKRVQNFSDEELSSNGGLGVLDGDRRFTVDGVVFPVIRRDKVPPGVVRVPITLYGDVEEKKVTLLAGSMGMQVIEEHDETAVQPASGWWMLSVKQSRLVTGKRPLYAQNLNVSTG